VLTYFAKFFEVLKIARLQMYLSCVAIFNLFDLLIEMLNLSAGDLYTEAAEGATAAMKGRIANKYYALAEEVWSQISE
jgi:hypothetical protein